MPGNFIFRALKSIFFWNDVRGLKIFSKAAVGQINKNLIIGAPRGAYTTRG
jgi:hypothetical protein